MTVLGQRPPYTKRRRIVATSKGSPASFKLPGLIDGGDPYQNRGGRHETQDHDSPTHQAVPRLLQYRSDQSPVSSVSGPALEAKGKCEYKVGSDTSEPEIGHAPSGLWARRCKILRSCVGRMSESGQTRAFCGLARNVRSREGRMSESGQTRAFCGLARNVRSREYSGRIQRRS